MTVRPVYFVGVDKHGGTVATVPGAVVAEDELVGDFLPATRDHDQWLIVVFERVVAAWAGEVGLVFECLVEAGAFSFEG